MKKIKLLTLLALVIMLTVAFSSCIYLENMGEFKGKIKTDQDTVINVPTIAHRGYSQYNVDNTARSFAEAAKENFYGIECDVRITKDGVYVTSHDARPFSGKYLTKKIENSNWEDIKDIPLPNKKTDSDEYLCLFDDYLSICKEGEKIAVIELKEKFTEEQVKVLLEKVDKYYSRDKIIIISFKLENLDTVKKVDDSIELQGLVQTSGALKKCLEAGYNVSATYKMLTRKIIKQFHDKGLTVATWTVNDLKIAAELQKAGVDFITSNFITCADVGYLCVHFVGNDPSQEKIYYSISLDGYNFKLMNDGNPVFTSTVGTRGIRDPFVFKLEDGSYQMLATDMHAEYGWRSNKNFVTANSKDLITWENETLIKVVGEYENEVYSGFESMKDSYCAWAPQAIYDATQEAYMIYFTASKKDTGMYRTETVKDEQGNDKTEFIRNEDGSIKEFEDDKLCIYYCYTTDFINITEPQLLFEEEHYNILDADIIYKDGLYYLFYRCDRTGGINVVKSILPDDEDLDDESATASLTGPYGDSTVAIEMMSEGNMCYKIVGTTKYVVMSDMFWMNQAEEIERFDEYDGYYKTNVFAVESTDFINFTPLSWGPWREISDYHFGDFPETFIRHGYVIAISRKQYYELVEHFGIK